MHAEADDIKSVSRFFKNRCVFLISSEAVDKVILFTLRKMSTWS